MRKADRPSLDDLRATLWFVPAVACVLAVVVALALLQWRPDPGTTLADWAWPGGLATARTLLTTVATLVITASTLLFSLTIIALQLASQQFSPRLLRDFARDWRIQAALGVLLSTFLVSVLSLRGLDPGRPLPTPSLLAVQLLGVLSVAALLAFVAHLVRLLRVDTLMATAHRTAATTIAKTYPPAGEGRPRPGPALPGPDGGTVLRARRSGFVRVVHAGDVAALARDHGVFLRLGVRPGDNIVRGTPVASAWSDDDRPVPVDALAQGLLDVIDVGYERTEEQDVAFGFRQLADIAIKAISPSINDPTTCATALGYCADLLVRLAGSRLGAQVVEDPDGRARAVLPDRDFAYYLDLSCDQVRRFAQQETAVHAALLRLLRDVGLACRDDDQRDRVRRQAQLVLDQLPPEVLDADRAVVREHAERVRLALRGEQERAYHDPTGVFRSF